MAAFYDVAGFTATSESHPRTAKIDTLQLHHTATPSDAASRDAMSPGGRQVSANDLLLSNGLLMGVVPIDRRAFTSAVPAADQRSFTVETVNLSGAPNWLISLIQHDRLAQLAVDLYRAGMLGGFFYGMGGIIQHKDVPGTYATACAGPSMNTDYIIAKAKEINAGGTAGGGTEMGARWEVTDDSKDKTIKKGTRLIIDSMSHAFRDVTGNTIEWNLAGLLGYPVISSGGDSTQAYLKGHVAIGAGPAIDIDEAALAKALAPLLPAGASKADITAAVASIKAAIPTKFTAG